jgi:antitoxin HigA-1
MRAELPVSPGEMLNEDFLKPLGLTKHRLAKVIGDVMASQRAVTADIDLPLCRDHGIGDGWWLRAHASNVTALAKEAMFGLRGVHCVAREAVTNQVQGAQRFAPAVPKGVP